MAESISGAEVEQIIFAAVNALNEERDPADQIAVSLSTPLFGVDSEIDSLSFVSVIADVEAALNLDHRLEISLADDRALSRPQTPYTTVGTLKDYILELTEERR